LAADGRKGPFFVQTKEAKLAAMDVFNGVENAHLSYVPIERCPRTKKNIRPAERGMVKYLEYMIHDAKFLKEGDFILFDGEKSFTTPLIRRILEENGITYRVFKPSILHQFLNPADNNFHSLFKLKYYRLISRGTYATLSLSEKFKKAKQSYDAISDESIVSMFVRCGLVNSELDKRSIVHNLVFEGIRALDKHNGFHKLCLKSYLRWCKENDLRFLCSGLTRNMLRMAGMLK
jgi:hypothetical protein